MQLQTSIKPRLAAGERLNGCWIETFSFIAAEIMAQGGYDTAMIDLEHGPGSHLDAISMMQAVANHGCAPLIRVVSSDSAEIKRVLDLGPAGIMVPNVRSAEEARSVVSACRYGPAGHRGAAPSIIRGSGYGMDLQTYAERMQRDFLVIGQIESKQAVDEIEDIAAVDGLDMLFIGPADLSADLGNLGGFKTRAFTQAFARIEQSVLAAGKWLGSIPFPGWDPKRLYANGHTLVISGADTLLIREGAERDVGALRKAASVA